MSEWMAWKLIRGVASLQALLTLDGTELIRSISMAEISPWNQFEVLALPVRDWVEVQRLQLAEPGCWLTPAISFVVPSATSVLMMRLWDSCLVV